MNCFNGIPLIVSEFNQADISDPFKYIYSSLVFKVSLTLLGSVCLMFGNVMYVGIIHFERFGGDPKKRTVSNRLISVICSLFMWSSISYFTLLHWRAYIGPLNKTLVSAHLISKAWLTQTKVILVIEILTQKMMELYKVKLPYQIDEDWFSVFLTIASFLLSAITEALKFPSGGAIDYDYRLYTGTPLWLNPNVKFGIYVHNIDEGNRKRLTKFAAICVALAVFICLWGVKIYRESMKLEPTHSISIASANPDPDKHKPLNTIKSNKAVITVGRLFIVLVLFMTSFAPKPIFNYVRPEPTTLIAAAYDLPVLFCLGFAFPFSFYYWNDEARTYAKRLIWDNLQDYFNFSRCYSINV